MEELNLQFLLTSGNYIYSILLTNLDISNIVILIIIISLELIALGVRDLENNTLKWIENSIRRYLIFMPTRRYQNELMAIVQKNNFETMRNSSIKKLDYSSEKINGEKTLLKFCEKEKQNLYFTFFMMIQLVDILDTKSCSTKLNKDTFGLECIMKSKLM